MSAQVKKHFEDLSTYLNRDASGLEKLKNLKDAVGVLRKRLVTSEEHAARSAETERSALAQLRQAKQDAERLQLELHTSQQTVLGLTQKLEVTQKATQAEVDDSATPLSTTHAEVKSAIKALRRYLPQCPTLVTRRITKDVIPTYDRESIAQGWSHRSLWVLGAAVAAILTIEHRIVIQTDKIPFIDDLPTDPDTDESVYRHIIRWFRGNIDLRSTTAKAGPVRLINYDQKI